MRKTESVITHGQSRYVIQYCSVRIGIKNPDALGGTKEPERVDHVRMKVGGVSSSYQGHHVTSKAVPID